MYQAERRDWGAISERVRRWPLEPNYLRLIMPKKKDKPVNATKARVRVAAPKRAAAKRTARNTRRAGRTKGKQPPQKLFDAKKWFGAFPELKGPTLTIQRRMRDEW